MTPAGRRSLTALAALAAINALGCRDSSASDIESSKLLDQRKQEVEQRIASAANARDFTRVARWVLPDALREVSGLALTSDGRILAHNDERGRVYVIDPLRGVVMKQFSIGNSPVLADFEAIAVRETDIYLMASNGDIYRFREGDDGAKVPFRKIDTKLGKECEFEGLDVEPDTGAFLLLCKVIGKKSQRNQILIYRLEPQASGAASLSTISVPIAEAVGSNGWNALAPSDIAIDPSTGNYVIITGREKALIEITPDGDVVRSIRLPNDPQQPEGVAISREGLIMIGDEGITRAADINVYTWKKRATTDNSGDTTL